jgi:hypothetical protein
MYTDPRFEGMATGEKSRFQYSSYSDSMLADSKESIMPRIPHDIPGRKTMITSFFTRTRLLVLKILSKGTNCNQDYCIHAVFQDCTT